MTNGDEQVPDDSARRSALDLLLEGGMAADAVDHARQVAMITSIVASAFEDAGMQVTLVGGSAIEVHAPGIFKSGDIDLVIEALRGPTQRDRLDPVFARLGFERSGRHWKRGELFVEVPSLEMSDPTQLVRVGLFPLRIVVREVLLSDRVVGFKHWKHTSYGEQAIEMIVAFGKDLDTASLRDRLRRESAVDAFEALEGMAAAGKVVTEEALQALLEQLHALGR
ncbi:MAG: hypothetical protein IT361_02920 [Gemmatimonadaceae bacterium]|nr:hypothetical protein [Gemmatimonadaceae bacterium]